MPWSLADATTKAVILFFFPPSESRLSSTRQAEGLTHCRSSSSRQARPLRPADVGGFQVHQVRPVLSVACSTRGREKMGEGLIYKNLEPQNPFTESILFNLFRRDGPAGFSSVPGRLAFIEQIRIISLVCHFLDCKVEGGILILHLLNSLPTILVLF